MDRSLIIRLLLVVLMLYMLYSLGIPLAALAVLAVLFVLFVLMRGPAYNRIDAELTKRFPFISSWAPWQKKLLVAAVFVLAYLLLKQGLYELLKMMGMDVQQMMLDSVKPVGG